MDGLEELYLLAGKYENAISAFCSVLKSDSGSIPGRLGLAEALMALDQRHEAATSLLEVLELDERNIMAFNLLQELY